MNRLNMDDIVLSFFLLIDLHLPLSKIYCSFQYVYDIGFVYFVMHGCYSENFWQPVINSA